MPLTTSDWAIQPDHAPLVIREIARELQPAESTAAAIPAVSDAADTQPYAVQNGVAVIEIKGAITRESVYSFWSGRKLCQGQDEIRDAVQAALSDPAVKAMLLSFDSPGGVVAGTKELADYLASASRIKPMAAYADGLMASAAMWLGASTGRVYAPATATVGSVGVINVHTDLSKLNERFGVVRSYITAGKHKAVGNPDEPLSDEGRTMIQQRVNQVHAIFKTDVASRLGITAEPDQWAEGQCLLAGDALAVGLVTTVVRDRDSAIATLRTEASMDLQTFTAKHPDLLAEVTAQAQEEARAALEKQYRDAAEADKANLLLLVKTVAGDETASRIESMVKAGVTPAQLAALGPLLAQPSEACAAQPSKEEVEMGKILAGLEATGNKPVTGHVPAAKDDEARLRDEAIDRMAAM